MSTLPDCMMPDGAEPCQAFQDQAAEISRLKAEVEFYKSQFNAKALRNGENVIAHDKLRSDLAASQALVGKLRETLRKLFNWADCIAMRVEKDRDQINWNVLNEARDALAAYPPVPSTLAEREEAPYVTIKNVEPTNAVMLNVNECESIDGGSK